MGKGFLSYLGSGGDAGRKLLVELLNLGRVDFASGIANAVGQRLEVEFVGGVIAVTLKDSFDFLFAEVEFFELATGFGSGGLRFRVCRRPSSRGKERLGAWRRTVTANGAEGFGLGGGWSRSEVFGHEE